MKRKGRKLMFLLAMSASLIMLFGCVKNNSENKTAIVETPTPTPEEMPDATDTLTPEEKPEPTDTPEPTQTVVSAVEMEDNDEYNDSEINNDHTSSEYLNPDLNDDSEDKDNGSDIKDNNDNNTNTNNNNNTNHAESNDGNEVNMNFADNYQAREELSDEEVGYGSDNVPEASEPVSPGEGNQAKIASAVYVRSGPGTKYEIIGSLYEGDTVVVLGNEGGWLKINYGNSMGYFYQDYVALEW